MTAMGVQSSQLAAPRGLASGLRRRFKLPVAKAATALMAGLVSACANTQATERRVIEPAVVPDAHPGQGQSAKPVILGVFQIEDPARQFTSEELAQLTSLLQAKLAEGSKFEVIPDDQLRSRLQQEVAGSYEARCDTNCQIELGKAASAQKTLVTKVLAVAHQCAVTATLFDLKRQATERAVTRDVACIKDDLARGLGLVARALRGEPDIDPAPTAHAWAEPSQPATGPPSSVGAPAAGHVSDSRAAPFPLTTAASPEITSQRRSVWPVPVALLAAGLGVGAFFEVEARQHAANANDPSYVGGQLEVGRATTAQTVAFVSLGAGVLAGAVAWYLSGD